MQSMTDRSLSGRQERQRFCFSARQDTYAVNIKQDWKEGMRMKKQAIKYLVFGIVFLALGIVMLATGAVSKTMAYGDFVLAIAFLGLSMRAKKVSRDEGKNE